MHKVKIASYPIKIKVNTRTRTLVLYSYQAYWMIQQAHQNFEPNLTLTLIESLSNLDPNTAFVCVFFSQFYKHVIDLELAAAEKEFAAYTWEEEGSLGIGVKPM